MLTSPLKSNRLKYTAWREQVQPRGVPAHIGREQASIAAEEPSAGSLWLIAGRDARGQNGSMNMLDKVLRTIERYEMLRPGERVVVAVSGGPDSVALLYALCELRAELEIELIVAHLDHMMRPGSGEDAKFVGQLAESLKLPLVSGAVDVPALIKAEGLSPEEGARLARYRFLKEAAKEHKAEAVALGHTMNDRVETFFINLLRGAGLEGLAGMPPVRHERDVRYIRPLIECSRAAVLEFLRERGLKYREDPTNRDLRYLRNRVRWRLLPLLEEYNPRVLEAVARAAEVLYRANEHLERLAEGRLKEALISKDPQGLTLDRSKLLAQEELVQQYLIRSAVRQVKGDLQAIEAVHIEKVLRELRKGRSGGEVSLPQGIRFLTYGDRVVFTRRPRRKARPPFCYKLQLGVNELRGIGWRFELEVLEGSHPKPGSDLEARIDYDRIVGPLIVRNRRRGDRFEPLGLGGTKKLQDLFVDEKIPREERDEIPLLCDQEGILWVVGLRLSERAKVTQSTRRTLRVRAERMAGHAA